MHLDGSKERRGGSGRVPDKLAKEHEKFIRLNISLPPDLEKRLSKFCDDEERAKSWVIQKALDKWLHSKGY